MNEWNKEKKRREIYCRIEAQHRTLKTKTILILLKCSVFHIFWKDTTRISQDSSAGIVTRLQAAHLIFLSHSYRPHADDLPTYARPPADCLTVKMKALYLIKSAMKTSNLGM